MIQGKVEVASAGTDVWSEGKLNQVLYAGDRVKTGARSRAEVYLSSGTTIQKGEFSEIEIQGGRSRGSVFLQGIFKIFNRERTKGSEFKLLGTTAAVRGTDFLVVVTENWRAELTVLDGEVALSNATGGLLLNSNEIGIIESHGALRKTAMVKVANDLVQWSLYYPGVLNIDELEFAAEEERVLRDSLNAYRAGDLLQAVAICPWKTEPTSGAGLVFRAALLLSVGQVENALALLAPVVDSPSARGLEQLIATVKSETWNRTNPPITATEWLAESYYRQSHYKLFTLGDALNAALAAATNAPNFGFAWARVAELEFSFGHTTKALTALDRSLQLSPRNAQAISLRGFLLAAQNKIPAAIFQFDQAIAADSALGNAWWGRGLCLIRQGRAEEGLRDLLVAASLESQRSVLRSYLGKAFADTGDERHAAKEFSLAQQLDPRDPTPWFYSALLHQKQHRYNEGILDLEQSLELNDNRLIYRSRLLLDEDRAVRSANLADIYQNAGMPQVSLREASRASSYDYANYSAHLFVSESFNALRDPTRFNLRYETVWFNELLLANLLSPVGGTPLSQNISQQEYARLFDQNRIGLSSSTEYRSDGQTRELVSQFGTIGNTGWSLDLDYQHNDGVRLNNDLDRIEWYSTIKQQMTPQDSVLVLTKYQNYHSGDNFQYYNPTNARPNFRFDEYQSPIALLGYHHEWKPGVHSLLLAGRLENDQQFSDLGTFQTLIHRPNLSDDFDNLDVHLRSKLEIYTVEAQQIAESTAHTLVAGVRWQGGSFATHALMTNPLFYNGNTNLNGVFQNPPADANVESDFERLTGYAYETLKLPGRLNVTAGLAVEHMHFPENFRSPPIQSGEETRNRVNPKASILWDALPHVTVRGVYAQSLGGVSLDESYRLEPTQLAGFSQTFRSVIPESLIGSVSAPDHEIWGAALDLKFPTRTYVGLDVQRLHSEVWQTAGIFDLFLNQPFPNIVPSGTRQHLDYEEHSFNATLNQLLSEEWGLGAQYSFARSALKTSHPDLATVLPTDEVHADLHHIDTYLLFNHRSGFFARADWDFYYQSRSRAVVDPFTVSDVPNETLHQINFSIGYRFPRQRGDLTFGVLNVTGQDYNLNPVTPYAELPRKPVFYARLRFRF